MERQRAIVLLHEAAKRLENLLQYETRDWLFAVASGSEDSSAIDHDGPLEDCELFQLLCYFLLIKTVAASGVNITLERPQGSKYRVSWKKGNKDSFVFFRVQACDEVYDLCCETAVQGDHVEKSQHPDISIQQMQGTNDGPVPGIVVGIWDAKHHKAGRKSTGSDFDEMNRMADILGPFQVPRDGALKTMMSGVFGVSAIITDAECGYLIPELCIRNGFSIVSEFDGESSYVGPQPGLREHLEGEDKSES